MASDMEAPLSPGAAVQLRMGKSASLITDRTLRNYNIAAFVLHFTQGTAMMVASQAVSSIKEFRKELTTSFLAYDEDTQSLVSATRNIGQVGVTGSYIHLDATRCPMHPWPTTERLALSNRSRSA